MKTEIRSLAAQAYGRNPRRFVRSSFCLLHLPAQGQTQAEAARTVDAMRRKPHQPWSVWVTLPDKSKALLGSRLCLAELRSTLRDMQVSR